jgi:hypothetical protein
MNIQLPTGKTISVSVYEYLFVLKEDEIDLFYQSCIADDLGVYIEDAFSSKAIAGRLEFDDELPEEISKQDNIEDI